MYSKYIFIFCKTYLQCNYVCSNTAVRCCNNMTCLATVSSVPLHTQYLQCSLVSIVSAISLVSLVSRQCLLVFLVFIVSSVCSVYSVSGVYNVYSVPCVYSICSVTVFAVSLMSDLQSLPMFKCRPEPFTLLNLPTYILK